tara:strand:- start:217 stop:366 length:150 start_codon:yes stop_codon:yes gene_type:complete
MNRFFDELIQRLRDGTEVEEQSEASSLESDVFIDGEAFRDNPWAPFSTC